MALVPGLGPSKPSQRALPDIGSHAIHTIERNRRHNLRRIVFVFLGLALLSLIAIGSWLFYSINIPKGGGAVKIVMIESGSSINQIASQLDAEGLIQNQTAFALYARLGPAHGLLKPGPYQLKSSMSMVQIIDYLASGKLAVKNFVAKDGLTLSQLAASYEAQGMGTAAEFNQALAVTAMPALIANQFPQAKQNLEGFLLADTYQLIINDPASVLITKMLDNFSKQAQPLFSATAPGKLTSYQALIMASIVEKEASLSADRAGIAGVFYNRLKNGTKLESDVTVIYLTGRKDPTAADLNIDSPYNTRKNPGLPPTPINSPSISAIKATLEPTVSNNLFFIGGKDGKTYFATTYAEHQANIAQHLK